LENLHLRRHFSRNILLRMLIFAGIAAALIYWKLDFINDVYFRDQLTPTGLIINGSILALFGIGLLKMIATFSVYAREESALLRFVHNLRAELPDPLSQVRPDTIIARRYRTLEKLHESRSPINHGALAATLLASESTRNSLPKFVNNILILTGVFGTIVSLSIALIGASDLLESTIDVGGMGLVVHGMSTALSTTITAILCYLYFGYFYLKLTDVQTNLVSGVEQITVSQLVPRFQVETDTVLYEFTALVRSLQGLVGQMESSQRTFESVEKHLVNTLNAYSSKVHSLSDDLDSMKRLLREGFRLPDRE
jgi:hypothetical protein